MPRTDKKKKSKHQAEAVDIQFAGGDTTRPGKRMKWRANGEGCSVLSFVIPGTGPNPKDGAMARFSIHVRQVIQSELTRYCWHCGYLAIGSPPCYKSPVACQNVAVRQVRLYLKRIAKLLRPLAQKETE